MAIPTAMNAGMKNALAPASVMMIAVAMEMSVNRKIFLHFQLKYDCLGTRGLAHEEDASFKFISKLRIVNPRCT